MKEITAEGMTYLYLAQDEDIWKVPEVPFQVQGFQPFMGERLQQNTDMRLVLTRGYLYPEIASVHYLHWDDGSDLTVLDEKVENDAYSDADFRNAVATVYQRTICFTCFQRWHTLVMREDPYLLMHLSSLFEEKYQKRRNSIKRCPNCGAFLRQLVVKIFAEEQAGEDQA